MKQLFVIIVLFALAAPLCASTYEVPFSVDHKRELMIVELAVNGRAARFVIDPVCASNVVSGEFSRVYAKTVPEAAFFANAPSLPKQQVILARLELGGGKWIGQRLSVMTAEQLESSYKTPIDGVLGRDFLKQFRSVTIDYEKKVLRLRE